MANYCTRSRPWVKGLSLEGGRANFSKKPPRHFLLERPIEWAYFRPHPSRWTVPLMCNLYFMSLFISIWKTGVENNTRAQCPLPFCICCVQYNTVVQYNIEAALWTIFTLQTSFAGGGGEGGKLWALGLFSIPVILLPINVINSIFISDLYSIFNIYNSNI
jgi:hypothetical protein